MGMGMFARATDKPGEAAGPSSEGGAGESVAPRPRKKSIVVEQEEEDDKHIRFTINGVGKRMTKEDFIMEMQKLDKKTRRDIIDESNASQTVKTLAKQDPQPQPSQPLVEPMMNQKDHAPVGGSSHEQSDTRTGEAGGVPPPPSSRPPSLKQSAALKTGAETEAEGTETETEVERRRRLAVLEDGGGPNGEADEAGETAAERRRREAALGMASPASEDSDDDDTPRVPPSKRAIRFADAPERGRK